MKDTLTTLEALAFWHSITTRVLRELEHDLSSRQLGILLRVYMQEGPHTVRSLAEGLDISKAAVCRAVDALSAAKMLKRKKYERDKRNVFIQRTIQGSVFLSDMADILVQEEQRLRQRERARLAA